MAENITTLLDMTDAENISGDDYLYLVQGSGSKRDRKLKLSALFSSDPSHTLVVDSEDDIPGEFLLGKFDQYSHNVYHDTDGKVRFYADTTSAGRIIRGEPKNLDGSEFNTKRVQFMAAVIDFGRQDRADCVQNFSGTSKFYKAEVDQELKVRNGGVNAGGGLSVPKPNSENYNLAKIDGRTGDIQTVGKVKGFGAEFSSIDIAGRAKAVTFEGIVKTNYISDKDSSKPIYVSAISGFNITGKSSVSGDFSSGSLKTGKIAYENLSLNDNMGIAPVLPYFLDNSGTGRKNLSEILAEAPKGARITFINNSGKNKEYHFTTTDVEGVAGGYFTLKAGRAVDIIVNNVLSVSQVSLLPIGIDYKEGGNL